MIFCVLHIYVCCLFCDVPYCPCDISYVTFVCMWLEIVQIVYASAFHMLTYDWVFTCSRLICGIQKRIDFIKKLSCPILQNRKSKLFCFAVYRFYPNHPSLNHLIRWLPSISMARWFIIILFGVWYSVCIKVVVVIYIFSILNCFCSIICFYHILYASYADFGSSVAMVLKG